MPQRKCYLRNITNNKVIDLHHEQMKILGRNPETHVEDPFVSREQLKCMANLETGELSIKPIGSAISGIDGYAVRKDRTYTIGHGHRIELRFGFHVFEVVFEPPLETHEDEVPTKKQKMDYHLFSNTKNQQENPPFSEGGKWEDIDNRELLIYTSENTQGRSKIAAFDIDGTIIKTKSGARFPKDGDDWVLNLDNIPQKLRNLNKEGHKIVFCTNQSGVGRDSFKIKDFKRKIENVIKKIAVPIQVFVALGKTIYRKPVTGMWNVLKDRKNDDVDINIGESFYVGDAAGREKNWAPKRNKDHSLADRLFALNVGLTFYTPEEYFLKAKAAPYIMPEFDPRDVSAEKYPGIDFEKPNVIVMVGGPGSGKSHFAKSVLVPKGFVHINRDKLGSWQKCVKVLEDSLDQKKSCVIDNTNPDIDSRARFVEVAKKSKVPCRCFVMLTGFQQTKHNNKFRELTDKSHVPVSDIIINSHRKKYQEPDVSEGFEEVVKIPFVLKFENREHEELYRMFLLEK
ncbi:hypothetical protein JTB14_034929 [Gonioctena quinquepunctata]|nr:hypothetical protein JTB14_034929 [Gonioctena quinquepunctata]